MRARTDAYDLLLPPWQIEILILIEPQKLKGAGLVELLRWLRPDEWGAWVALASLALPCSLDTCAQLVV